MKQEYDKEIDSLLRRGARLAAAAPQSAASSRAAFASPHLDADELSAFAENALPAAARLAAASHLADCDACRGMVVRLASAADTAGEIEKSAAASPVVPVEVPWWKTLLGSLFAPRVLRYAAPALVLGLVGVVSFIALRPRQGSVPATVYQNEEARDASTASAPGGSAATTTGTYTDSNTGASAPPASNTSPTIGSGGVLAPASPAKPGEQPAVNQPVVTSTADRDASPADASGAGVAGKTAGPVAETVVVEGKEETRDRPAASTVVAPAPAPPAAKSAGTEVVEMPKGARNAEPARRTVPEVENLDYAARAQQESRAANQSRNRQGEVQMPDGGGSPRNEGRAMNRGNVGAVNSLPTTRSERERPAAKRGRADDARARETAGDDEAVRVDATRSVGGRRFRREGGAWVDVNYKPSMSMTAVRRGTEGYRALVADIPELGRIAEQLGGEVITVVKGRAYRIR